MYDPDGYLHVQYIVAWVAGLGAQGKLPRRLGFVHPGDVAEPNDLPADTTARFVLAEKMAAGALTALVVVDPEGLSFPSPAHYWRGASAAATMQNGRYDLSAVGLDNDLHTASVLLAPPEVAAALGFRLAPPEEPAAPEPKLQSDDAWMHEYATRFLAENKRPPSRDNEAVPDAQKEEIGVNRARTAYRNLPSHLKNPARKPRKS